MSGESIYISSKKMKHYNIKPTIVEMPFGPLSCIQLGEEGRGRTQVNIPCPEKFDGLEVGKTKTGGVRLNACGAGRPGWIIRLNSEGNYIRGGQGFVALLDGEAEVLARGTGAFGAAGRVGGWDDLLVVVPTAATFRLKPTRGDSWVVVVDDNDILYMTASEYRCYPKATVALGSDSEPFLGLGKRL